ncbi:MAG: carbohydrate kinase family protein [Paracoccaceae bacterium]
MILVGGENLMDMIQIDNQNENALFEAVPGGSPYNLAMAAGRQGVKVGYVTPISKDKNGEQLAQNLFNSNVSLLGPRVTAPTSLAMVHIEDAIPSYSFYREETAERLVTLDSLSKNLTSEVSIFHIGSLALTGGEDALVWEEFVKRTRESNVKVSLDPNVRPSLIAEPDVYRQRIKNLMTEVDILKLSDEDLLWLFNDSADETNALAELEAIARAEILIVTKGSQGSAIFHEKKWHEITSHPVEKLSDTVGAGDTFMASVLAWVMKKQKLNELALLELNEKKDLLNYAAKAAALNCEKQGCNPPWENELL